MARTGRPREFNRDQAVDAAMMLFWSQGYEPTSLSQLKEKMGNISPASFYAAFGSKEKLFREVVDRYLDTYGQVLSSLWDETLPARKALELALRRSAQMQTSPSHPTGCMLVLGASNYSPENTHIQALLAAERDRNRKGLKACIKRAIHNGELSPSVNVTALATAFDTFMLGMACEARDGVRIKNLDAAIMTVLQLWDLNAPVS